MMPPMDAAAGFHYFGRVAAMGSSALFFHLLNRRFSTSDSYN
jgi:hypothetical protein